MPNMARPMRAPTTLPETGSWNDLSSAGELVIAAGADSEGGGLLAVFDGTTWSTATVPEVMNAAFVVAPTEAYAVGQGGASYRFDGLAWTAIASGTTSDLHAVWARAGDMWAGGQGGTVVREATPVDIGTAADVLSISGSADDDVFIVTDEAGAAIRHFDGDEVRIAKVRVREGANTVSLQAKAAVATPSRVFLASAGLFTIDRPATWGPCRATEVCDDRIDNDCDWDIDGADSDCP